MTWTKLFHMSNFKGPKISMVSPLTEITLDNGGKLEIGENFKMRDGAKIRVRKGAICKIGKNTSVNCNNMIACHEKIEIGDNCQFAPNVQIYDHDHDYKTRLSNNKYKTAPIKIGNNVWIGSNVLILRGTTIGDNSVVGGGSVINGEFPPNSVIIQKRTTEIIKYEEKNTICRRVRTS